LRKLKNSYNSITADDTKTTSMDYYDRTSINETFNRLNIQSPLESSP